jgi:hypothetical protein
VQQSGRQRGQRVQGNWWTASDERKAELRALWPELVQAIADLDELLGGST